MRVALPLLLLVHLVGAGIAVSSERALVFSGAGAVAEVIRDRGLERLPLLVDRDYMGMAVLGYLDKDRAWYPAGSRWGSHIVWDTARFVTHGAWGDAVRLAIQSGSPVLVLLDAKVVREQPQPSELRAAVGAIACRVGEVVEDETFCAWVLEPELVPRAILQEAR